MREIKFRVWSDLDNRYIRDARLFELATRDMPTREITLQDCDLYKFEQFTGLKDKNGVDIYEGDIIKSKYWNGVITWVDEFDVSGWYVMEYDQYGEDPQAFSKSSAEELFEVIGNVHEEEK